MQIYVSHIFIYDIGNTFNEEKFKEMISEKIKERENYILTKISMEIATDSRIVAVLNSSSMLSSKYNFTNVYIAQKGRSHLLLRDQEEEKSMKGLMNIAKDNKRKYLAAESENEYLKVEIEKISLQLK